MADAGGHMAIEATDNYIFSPKKFVALVGVENLVIVDTEDALLDCAPRPLAGRGQDCEGVGPIGADRPDLKMPAARRDCCGRAGDA